MADDFIGRKETMDILKAWGYYGARNVVNRIAAADVRHVVLCKDCKSCNTDIAVNGWYGMCTFWNGHSVMADDYCSRCKNKDSSNMSEVD